MGNYNKKLNKNVILTGFTALFTDISYEMICPLIQSFVSYIFSQSASLLGQVLGIIEGKAVSFASLLKLYFGHLDTFS